MDLSGGLDMLRPSANFDKVELDDGRPCYGELILLGYNGCMESAPPRGARKSKSKMTLKQRVLPNGVKKGATYELKPGTPQILMPKDPSRYTVTYYDKDKSSAIVEYPPDAKKDMFQIGRSSEDQIDFTIVDTWLAAGSPNILSPAGGHSKAVRAKGMCRDKPITSTISRFACRLLCDREEPNKCYVYAAGFDSVKNIFLGDKAIKWQKKSGEWDGLTTNGVLILHPNRHTDIEEEGMYVWREITVDGEICSLRDSRSSTRRGELVRDETNQLQDGTLIDLCGATLLWRSAEGLAHSPSTAELERRLDELNAGKPQCPVNLNTLIVPRKKPLKSNSKQPYVYLACGHVQGKHNWGVTPASATESTMFRCPICMIDSELVIQLTMGMESAFHWDSDNLEYAFNPCGHVASRTTVQYWSRIPLPHGTNSFYPVCPFCTTLLDNKKPYVRLIFQDHCYDS